jgi:hypothetical protein
LESFLCWPSNQWQVLWKVYRGSTYLQLCLE